MQQNVLVLGAADNGFQLCATRSNAREIGIDLRRRDIIAYRLN
jgi:hypothetical protein